MSPVVARTMDFYQEQHSYTLARNTNIRTDESDEESSWVMMSREGEVIKLPGEKIYYKVRSRIGLDLSTPKSLPNATPFSIKSDGGIIYVTNNRVRWTAAGDQPSCLLFCGCTDYVVWRRSYTFRRALPTRSSHFLPQFSISRTLVSPLASLDLGHGTPL